MTIPNELRTAAWFYSQNASNATARAKFDELLNVHSHPAVLVELASQFATLPEISINALERLVNIAPTNIGYLVQLGTAHFIAGQDDAAEEWLARAKSIVPHDYEVLNLEATLARDNDSKRSIYARMLELYPTDRAAFENLVALREPEDHS